MVSVLANRQVLILIPFYLYIGLFFSFWVTIIPTTFQFTMVSFMLDDVGCRNYQRFLRLLSGSKILFQALSKNVYVPIYYGAAFTAGSVTSEPSR